MTRSSRGESTGRPSARRKRSPMSPTAPARRTVPSSAAEKTLPLLASSPEGSWPPMPTRAMSSASKSAMARRTKGSSRSTLRASRRADARGRRQEGALAVQEMGHPSHEVGGMALGGRIAAATEDLHDLRVAHRRDRVHGVDHGQQRRAPRGDADDVASCGPSTRGGRRPRPRARARRPRPRRGRCPRPRPPAARSAPRAPPRGRGSCPSAGAPRCARCLPAAPA